MKHEAFINITSIFFFYLLTPCKYTPSGALSYAELGAMLPSSGGEHAYLLHVFGDLPAYLFAWTFTIIIKPCILSIISLVCGIYIVAAMGIRECGDEGGTDLAWVQKIFAGIVLRKLLLSLVSY